MRDEKGNKKEEEKRTSFIIHMNNITNALHLFSAKKNLFNSPSYVVGWIILLTQKKV